MALLTPEEIEEFDQKIFQNVASNFLDIKCVSSSIPLFTNGSFKKGAYLCIRKKHLTV